MPTAGTMSDLDVFTIAELAVRWRTSRQSIMEAIHTGRLTAFKIGLRVYRVALAEVTRFESVPANLPKPANDATADVTAAVPARRVGGR